MKLSRRSIVLAAAIVSVVVVVASLVAWGSPAGSMAPGSSPTLAAAGSGAPPPATGSSSTAAPTPWPSLPSSSPILVGAGDICQVLRMGNAQQTAALVEALPSAAVFTLGDNSNDSGTVDQYATCYGDTWGAFKARTRPTAGNHDHLTSDGAPYYAYFGAAAGPAGKGYYSYDLAQDWHVIVLNAICGKVGGCEAGSPQESWLRSDLAANHGKHVIAMWHIPRFSSGLHGSSSVYQTWWQDLYDAHAEIVLNGHDHEYERFAPQSPDRRGRCQRHPRIRSRHGRGRPGALPFRQGQLGSPPGRNVRGPETHARRRQIRLAVHRRHGQCVHGFGPNGHALLTLCSPAGRAPRRTEIASRRHSAGGCLVVKSVPRADARVVCRVLLRNRARPRRSRSPSFSALLSFLWPGLGQLYAGRLGCWR